MPSNNAGPAAAQTSNTASYYVAAVPPARWYYSPPTAGLVNTTEVTAQVAAGGGLINYISSIQVTNSHPTIGSEVQILDGTGGTVLHRGFAPALSGYTATFPIPLGGTANTLVSIKEATATATTGILVNLQGYIGN